MSTNRRFRQMADAVVPKDAAASQSFKPYPTTRAWAAAMRDALTFDQVMMIAARNGDDPVDAATGYFGTPPALHFVGFKGDEFTRAVKVFGKPDFIHRHNDDRLRFGGELAPHDTVVFANGTDNRPTKFTFDDSAVM